MREMTIRATVTSTILAVAAEQSKVLRPLTDDLPLLESGLDSLSLAVIVAKLEDELGNDPFSAMLAGSFPNTIGDLIHIYEHAPA
jgi:acyl carrier protein